jgi:hypothetical protein
MRIAQRLPQIRTNLVGLLLLLGSLSIYLLNGINLPSGDALGNSLTVFTWLETGQPYFDALHQTTQGTPAATWFGYLGPMRLANNGHWVSAFPIGTAVVTAPLYLLFYLYLKLIHWGAPLGVTQGIPFEPTRLFYEKLAAAIVAAVSVYLFFQISRLRFSPRIALLISIIYGFASSTWTISAQGLWQHGSLNLMLLVMIWSLCQASREQPPHHWLLLAGIACGWLPGIRQTGLLLSLVGLVYGWVKLRSRCLWLGWGLCLAALPWLWWNHAHFGYFLSGGYQPFVSTIYAWSVFPQAAPGTLISPSRGFLVYMPIALFALPGAWQLIQKRHRSRSIDWLLFGAFGASLGILLSYCFFSAWFAGGSYGARFGTDILPGVCWMIGYYVVNLQQQLRSLKTWKLSHWSKITAFILAGILSLLTQIAGVGNHQYSEWSVVPWPYGYPYPAMPRLWDWGDSQWLRRLRGIQHRRYAQHLNSPAYLQQFQAQLLGVTTLTGEPIQLPLTMTAQPPYRLLDVLVQNQGRQTWYGYQNGIGAGEVYVHGGLYNSQQQLVDSAQFYLSGNCAPQAICHAQGMLLKPQAPATYQLILRPGILGHGVVNAPQNPPLQLPIVNLP